MKSIEPYRLFFPLGIFYGIWGVLGWVSYFLNLTPIFPIQAHFHIMTYGFMLAFIIGFIMTAVPNQTRSYPALPYEMFMILGLFIVNTFISDKPHMLYASTTLIFIIINLFIQDRYRHRRADVDSFFQFIRIGFAIGLVHSFLSLIHSLWPIPYVSTYFLKLLFYDGFVLFIVFGIGATLIPNMFGYKQSNVFVVQGIQKSSISRSQKAIILALLISFIVDLFMMQMFTKIVRFFILALLFNHRLKIYQLPPVRTSFTISVWASVWMTLIGYGLSALFPMYYIHALHVMLIGGFGLMILMIASRVTLAHGNYGFSLELKSKLLYILGSLIFLTALTRYTAVFWSKIYISHLGYAAIIWILTLLIWSFYFFKKMLIVNR